MEDNEIETWSFYEELRSNICRTNDIESLEIIFEVYTFEADISVTKGKVGCIDRKYKNNFAKIF